MAFICPKCGGEPGHYVRVVRASVVADEVFECMTGTEDLHVLSVEDKNPETEWQCGDCHGFIRGHPDEYQTEDLPGGTNGGPDD